MSATRAACDQPGCAATFLIAAGDEPAWALDWAGWQLLGDDVYCPDHRRRTA